MAARNRLRAWQDMTKTRETCFILGSGASLNNLTPEETKYLNEHPRILAFNKYLLFWTNWGSFPAISSLRIAISTHIVFARSVQISRQLQKPIPFTWTISTPSIVVPSLANH